MCIENKKKFIVNFAFWAIIFAIVLGLFKFIVPILSPFIIAFVIAFCLRKPISFISKTFKISYKVVAIIITGLFYATIGVGIALLGLEAWYAFTGLIGKLPTIYSDVIVPAFDVVFDNITEMIAPFNSELVTALESSGAELASSVGSSVSSLSMTLLGKLSSFAISLPGTFLKTVLMIISTFFISCDYGRITKFCSKQINDKIEVIILDIREYVVGTLWVCLKSYLIIMSITFVEMSIALTIIGIKNSILIAVIIAIFDILPVLGTGGIMIPWAIIKVLSGDFKLAISLAIIYLIVTIIRNIIEPKIVGGQLGLHPIVTLSSMFLGLNLIGGIGVFVMPIFLSLMVYLDKKGTINILNKDVVVPPDDIKN